MFELLLKGGHVIDPASGRNEPADVAFDKGRVAVIDRDIEEHQARSTVDVGGRYVVPGLIDLHTHVYWGGTSLGVDADKIAVRSGTTTFIDAGSAGAGNLLGFRKHVIERSRARILAYINVSFAGIFGFSHYLMVGENSDIRMCDARACRDIAREHTDILCGVKVRVGLVAGGTSGAAPLDIAIESAESLHMPVMAHIDKPPPSRRQVINRLRPQDVLTHCFKPYPSAPITADRTVREEILAARERGVIFDIGHGMGSFDFEVARGMIDEGFYPDVISSDIHALNIDGPAYDLLHTMSKFLALGLPVMDIVRMASSEPARAIARSDLGRLAPGSVGDAAVLDVRQGRYTFTDVLGQKMSHNEAFHCDGIVIAGEWIPNSD
ncbi:MAG: amidohydrolase/deacetylase family metallohydrolase [Geminicoccaceae bacterium]